VTAPVTIRVLCFNIRSLRDDTTAVVRVISAARPDVVLVQEAPRFFRWQSRCRALASACGLTWVVGGREAGANLVLTAPTCEVLDTRTVTFTPYRNLHQRGAAVAVLRVGGKTITVAGTHLDLVEVPRLRHLDELGEVLTEMRPAATPLVLAGDLNAVPGSATWQRLARFGVDSWQAAGEGDGFTYPGERPVRRIDGIFVAGAPIVAATVLDSPDVRAASDHRPLIVELG